MNEKRKKRVVVPTIISLILLMLIVLGLQELISIVRLNNALTKQSQIIAKKNRIDFRAKQQLQLQLKASQEQAAAPATG